MDAIPDDVPSDLSADSYLAPADYIDSNDPDIIAFAQDVTCDAHTPVEKAIALYYAVRDRIRYDPYVAIADPESYRASTCLKGGRGFCVAKAGLLAACARAVSIPARVAYADVRNHLCTPRLREVMGTDIFKNHGYTELLLDDRWIKVTPTFNVELCEKFGVLALDFDGRNDALLHPFDKDGRRHMEYTAYSGSFVDVPADMLSQAMLDNYGADACDELRRMGGDFAAEAAQDGCI